MLFHVAEPHHVVEPQWIFVAEPKHVAEPPTRFVSASAFAGESVSRTDLFCDELVADFQTRCAQSCTHCAVPTPDDVFRVIAFVLFSEQ
jgi:hypothetical protein